MLEHLTCKTCGHPFADHQVGEYLLAWWCEGDGGNCGCDCFIIEDNNRSEQFNKFHLN